MSRNTSSSTGQGKTDHSLWFAPIYTIRKKKHTHTHKLSLTLSQTSPGFYVSVVEVLKTLWEKEKLLVTSNFSFSLSVFYPFR